MSFSDKDLDKAVKLFESGEYTCVLCRGDSVIKSCERGIKPLMKLLNDKTDVQGYSAADRIVGRAAAFLYILLKVTAVHASVMSKGAVRLLEENGIIVESDTVTDAIINRNGDDICPMEKAVENVYMPDEAFLKLGEAVSKMMKSKGE